MFKIFIVMQMGTLNSQLASVVKDNWNLIPLAKIHGMASLEDGVTKENWSLVWSSSLEG